MSLDSLLIDRLAIARQLFARSTNLSGEPNILGPALGVSLAQDGLELLLRGIADYHRVRLPQQVNFEDIIRELNKVVVDGATLSIPHQPRLTQVNKTRVNFKHFGVIPDATQARGLVAFAGQAADEICRVYLSISLHEATGVRLIRKARVRNYLTRARDDLSQRKYEESCISSGIAFALIFGRVTNRRFQRSREIARHTRGYHPRIRSAAIDAGEIADLARSVAEDFDEVADELSSVQRQVDLLKIGVNLDGLQRFEMIVPTIDLWHGRVSLTSYRRTDFSFEDAEYCLQFALDAILKGQPEQTNESARSYVEVLEDTPILASFPSPGRPAPEQIVIAERGDKYPLRRSEGLGGQTIEIAFEGDVCYIDSSKVRIVT